VAYESAYNSHDIDDALKMGLICENDLRAVDWVWDCFVEARGGVPEHTRDKFIKYRAIGSLIELMVADVLQTTTENLSRHGIKSIDDVRALGGRRIAGFSPGLAERQRKLKDFLMANVYRHPRVVRMSTKAEKFIERLFELYVQIPQQLPIKYQKRINLDGLERVVADYLSGMTDRYLQQDYIRAFHPTTDVL
jgi:dGTPase